MPDTIKAGARRSGIMWLHSVWDQKPYVPFCFWWPFFTTTFWAGFFFSFFLLGNLSLVKVSRQTAGEIAPLHYPPPTPNTDTTLYITVDPPEPSFFMPSIALLWSRCQMWRPQYCQCKAWSYLPHFLWIYAKGQTRSKAGDNELQQFLNSSWKAYLPVDFVFYSILDARSRDPNSSSSVFPYLLKTDLSLTTSYRVFEAPRHITDGGTLWPALSSDHLGFAILKSEASYLIMVLLNYTGLQHAVSLSYTELCTSHALPLRWIHLSNRLLYPFAHVQFRL